MNIFNNFLISMKNIKTFLKESLNEDKNFKSNSFINNIDEIILYLKLNEGKIKNRENISNSLFLKTINTNIKVLDIYNYLPKYIKEFILKSKDNKLISENDENILETFKNNILNVKLELFLNIENNLKEFKVFENKILNIFDKMIKLNLNDNVVKSFDIDSNKENKAKFLALSFYFYKIDKNLHNKNIKDKDIKDNINNKDNFIEINDIDENYLVSLIEKTISNINNIDNIDNNIFSNNFLPSNNELEMLKLNDVNFNTGLEYEFWLKNELFNIKDNIDQRNNIAFQRINEFFKLINLNSNPKLDIDIKNKNLKAKYETISEIKEETIPLNTYSNANKQYLEIISKKFNSISEMLVFHDFILKFINQIKIENNNEISFSRFNRKEIDKIINSKENKNLFNDEIYEKAEEQLLNEKQNKIYDEFPGSIHFNISIPNIENMNKLKFYLFLKDSNLIDKWEIRNDNVKDINLLINIFGPHIINSKELDKLWQINFSYLNNKDKSGNINPRLEIRYMGGKDYPNRINDINENLLKIMECVKISMDKDLKRNEYTNFVDKYDVDKKWNDLNDEEKVLCFKFFKTNDIKIAIEKFKEIKIELDEIKKRYINGFNR